MTNNEYPLSALEARQALTKLGTVVECQHGHQWIWSASRGILYKSPSGNERERSCGPVSQHKGYRIVEPEKPEPRKLTFEEALECKSVRIEYPDGRWVKKHRMVATYESGNPVFWHMSDLTAIDLADRRGWPMYDAGEE